MFTAKTSCNLCIQTINWIRHWIEMHFFKKLTSQGSISSCVSLVDSNNISSQGYELSGVPLHQIKHEHFTIDDYMLSKVSLKFLFYLFETLFIKLICKMMNKQRWLTFEKQAVNLSWFVLNLELWKIYLVVKFLSHYFDQNYLRISSLKRRNKLIHDKPWQRFVKS